MGAKLVLDPSRPGSARIVSDEDCGVNEALAKTPLVSAIKKRTELQSAIEKAVDRCKVPELPGLVPPPIPSPVAGLPAMMVYNPSSVVDQQLANTMNAITAAVGACVPPAVTDFQGSVASQSEELRRRETSELRRRIEEDRWSPSISEEVARAHQAREEREEQKLEELRAIRLELEHRRLERHDEEDALPTPDDDDDCLRTGAPGRPSSMQLVLEEFARRTAEGRIDLTLAEAARNMKAWLISEHPRALRPTIRTIENRLRAPYHSAKQAAAASVKRQSQKRRGPRK